MPASNDIYVYRMTADNGGAPCVYRRLLSLAICKPMIRRTAEVGSLVFGFGGKRLGERLIYVARITEKPEVGAYYREARFHPRPDCIYRDQGGHPVRISDARYHADSDQSGHDVGADFDRAHVLLSRDFRYFGAEGTTECYEKYPAVRKMVEGLKRGHRRNHDPELHRELLALKAALWKRHPADQPKVGEPSDADLSRRCNVDSASLRSGA